MNRKGLYLVVALLCLVGILTVACSQPAPAPAPTSAPTPTAAPTPQVIKLTGQDQYLKGPPMYNWQVTGSGYMHTQWEAFVKEISDGQIQPTTLDPGAIVPAGQQLDAVGKGIIDYGIIDYPGYYSAQYPEFDIQLGLPFSWLSVNEYVDAYKNWGLYDAFQKIYETEHNVHLMPITLDMHYGIHATFPITTLASLQGKKLRALGIYGELAKKEGASPTVVNAGELYQAMKLGTVDGAIYAASGLTDLKLSEVDNSYMNSPNLNVLGGSAIMNLDKWKSLPQDFRDKYDALGFSYMIRASTELGIQQDLYTADAAKKGVKIVTWSDADKAKIIADGIALWDTVAAKNQRCAELVDMVKKQMRALGRIP